MLQTLVPLSAILISSLWLAELPAEPQDGKPAQATERSTEKFQIDGAHSSVVFRVKHLRAAYFWGRFNQISGSFRVDDDRLEDSYIEVEIPAESLDSANAGRDRHLKSQDFFSVKEFPTITFKSTKVERAGDGYRVTGDLTLRGVTRSVTCTAEHTGTANISPRFGLRSGYEAVLKIKRSDFGMTYMTEGDAIGDDVTVTIAVEGTLPKK